MNWLDQVKARLKAATPGPWRKGQWEDGSQSALSWNVFADASEVTVVVDTVEVDAALIAHAPTDLDKAIRIIECYERKIKLAQGQCGIPVAADGCRAVIKTLEDAFAEAEKIKKGEG